MCAMRAPNQGGFFSHGGQGHGPRPRQPHHRENRIWCDIPRPNNGFTRPPPGQQHGQNLQRPPLSPNGPRPPPFHVRGRGGFRGGRGNPNWVPRNPAPASHNSSSDCWPPEGPPPAPTNAMNCWPPPPAPSGPNGPPTAPSNAMNCWPPPPAPSGPNGPPSAPANAMDCWPSPPAPSGPHGPPPAPSNPMNCWPPPPAPSGMNGPSRPCNFRSPPPGNYGHENSDFESWPGDAQGHRPMPAKRGYFHRGRGGQRGHNFRHGENRRRPIGKDGDEGPANKKEKQSKCDLPENNNFFCEVCDRGFKTQEKYKEHVDGHEQCRVDGCSYTAAPKLVKLHYEWQHRTGLAKKIWQTESKEEVEKWLAERKKNFPTKNNIAKKEAMIAECVARGEVLETQQFGRFRGRNRGRGRGRGRGHGRLTKFVDPEAGDSENQSPTKTKETEENEQSTSKEEKDTRTEGKDEYKEDCGNVEKNNNHKVSAEAETSLESSKKISGDPLSFLAQEKTGAGEEEVVPKATELIGGLGKLVASYGDEEDMSSDEDVVVKEPGSEKDGKTAEKPIDLTEAETEEPQANNAEAETGAPAPKDERFKRQRGRKGQRGGKGKNPKGTNSTRRTTLLQKLLAPDIRHERNVILQCVRHVIKMDYLGVGRKDPPTSQQLKGTVEADKSGEKLVCNE